MCMLPLSTGSTCWVDNEPDVMVSAVDRVPTSEDGSAVDRVPTSEDGPAIVRVPTSEDGSSGPQDSGIT